MSNIKMKRLFKGLRYISQMFENEKEPEMQIGNPTNVKHVAHIGWDGGAIGSPSWMKGFKTGGGFSSTPLGDIEEVSSCVSEESSRSRDMHGVPRSSRSRRSSNPEGNPKSSRKSKKNTEIIPDGLRKSRRKSSRSSRKVRKSINDSMSETGSMISITSDI